MRKIPTRKTSVPTSSMMPTMKYVAGDTPPWVTKREPEMSSIAPAKKSMKPRVAKVSFIFSGPEDGNTKSVRIKDLLAAD
jgi:hypothetical protein